MEDLTSSGQLVSTHKKGAPSGSQRTKRHSLDELKLPTHAASQPWRLIPIVQVVTDACERPLVFPQWLCNALRDPKFRRCDDSMVGWARMPDIAGAG